MCLSVGFVIRLCECKELRQNQSRTKTQKKYDLSFDFSLLSFSGVSVANKHTCGVVKTKPCKTRFKRIDRAAGVMWDGSAHKQARKSLKCAEGKKNTSVF